MNKKVYNNKRKRLLELSDRLIQSIQCHNGNIWLQGIYHLETLILNNLSPSQAIKSCEVYLKVIKQYCCMAIISELVETKTGAHPQRSLNSMDCS